mgnify:CR=1 FL=1
MLLTPTFLSTFLPQARAHVRASLSRVLDDRGARTEVSLGITLVLDHDHSASIESRHSQGEDIQSVRLRRPLPAAEVALADGLVALVVSAAEPSLVLVKPVKPVGVQEVRSWQVALEERATRVTPERREH